MSRRLEEFERTALPQLPGLLRFARRLTGNMGAAEDLVQETCLLAWKGYDGFEPGTNIRAWLFRILINAHRESARRQRPLIVTLPVDSKPAAETIEILDALDRLPEEQRTVLGLCVIEGFTGPEVSAILGVPTGTVMSRLSRGRQAMRELLSSRLEKVSR